MARYPTRKHPTVTRDDDGGLTIHDHDTGVVLSIVSTQWPVANGPRGLYVEAYAYATGHVAVIQDATTSQRHPTFAVYALPEEAAGKAQ